MGGGVAGWLTPGWMTMEPRLSPHIATPSMYPLLFIYSRSNPCAYLTVIFIQAMWSRCLKREKTPKNYWLKIASPSANTGKTSWYAVRQLLRESLRSTLPRPACTLWETTLHALKHVCSQSFITFSRELTEKATTLRTLLFDLNVCSYCDVVIVCRTLTTLALHSTYS